jgi:hypothetical protein
MALSFVVSGLVMSTRRSNRDVIGLGSDFGIGNLMPAASSLVGITTISRFSQISFLSFGLAPLNKLKIAGDT